MDFSSQDGGPVSKKKDRHLNKKQRSSWATKIASRQLRAGPGPFTSPRPWRSNQFVRLYAQSCRDSRYWGNCSSALSRMTCFFGGFSLYHICQTYIHCGRIETMPFGNGRSIEYVEPHESHTLFFIQNIFMKEKERERERDHQLGVPRTACLCEHICPNPIHQMSFSQSSSTLYCADTTGTSPRTKRSLEPTDFPEPGLSERCFCTIKAVSFTLGQSCAASRLKENSISCLNIGRSGPEQNEQLMYFSHTMSCNW